MCTTFSSSFLIIVNRRCGVEILDKLFELIEVNLVKRYSTVFTGRESISVTKKVADAVANL